ncbi:winged helix-turn-helix domain-containing protein [Sphaerisporangium sp. NPDC004334]
MGALREPPASRVLANTLDSYLVRIRRKLAEIGQPSAIVTVRGVGYTAT